MHLARRLGGGRLSGGRLLAGMLIVTTVCVALAQFPAPGGPVAPVRDLPLEDVTPGMSGYGLTAGPGDVIERFSVEVVAIQHDAGVGFDLVLVRASGPFIEASGGVAAGMSGSPVYLLVGGRYALLGAIGYVFPNADHGLALVTPIAAMRGELAALAASRPATTAQVRSGSASTATAPAPHRAVPAVDPVLGQAVPVATPVLLSGATARSAALLEPLFRNASVVPFPAQMGTASSASGHGTDLVPGSAVAVRLMGGAVDLAAIGTITTVDDGRLLAFGHPFLGIGPASYAVAAASVTTVVPSSVVPFKLANTSPVTLGTVDLDAPAGVAGLIGVMPATVRLTISLDTGDAQEVYDLQLAADERLYPTLTALATLQLVDTQLRRTAAGHAELAWDIELADGTRLAMLEQVNSSDDIAFDAARLAAGPLAILAENEFKAPAVTAVDMSVTLATEPSFATIASLVLEQTTVQQGGNAIVHVRLQPFRRQAIVRTFSVALPADVSGEVTLLVRGGDVPRDIADVPEEGGEVDEPRSFPELLDAMRSQLQASELIIESIDEDGAIVRLLRVALPFVVLESQEATLSVTPAAEAEGAGVQDANPDGDAGEGRGSDATGEDDTP